MQFVWGQGGKTVRQKRDEKKKKAKVIRKMDAGDLIYIFFIFVIIAQPVPLGAAFVTKVLQVSANL